MIFWVTTVLTATFIGLWINSTWNTDLIYSVLGRILAIICEIIVGGVVWVLVTLGVVGLGTIFTPDRTLVGEDEISLIALASKDSIEGRFGGSIFASYGYVNGVRVLSYATKAADGGISLGYLNVDKTLVYEGDESPKIVTQHWIKENGWFFPFGALEYTEKYRVYVPEGSVVQDFSIQP